MMIFNQRKAKAYSDRISSLLSDVSVKQREAEMLAGQLADAKRGHERQMDEVKRQFAERLDEVNRNNERDKEERTAMLDRQFAERLKLVQEQLNTTTERLLKQAEADMYAPLKDKLNAVLAKIGMERGYAFILNTDNDALPFVNLSYGEDVTTLVLDAIKE